ncbi:hypothetical protein Pint_29232 [Pistacia integerrima]|uniref:Uncharacterized protein n=1 Tax=Pistacia integerrima TaxID=434235 RepID=A0ACC0X447_9ROSI|nr:hypothetical protein Pint_29232 [Pistacia integerrima]
MEVDMETSSSFLDPEDLSIREKFRRYGKRHSASSISPHQQRAVLKINEPTLLYDGTNIHSPTNTALILENIKQEVQSVDYGGTPVKMQSASKRRSSIDSHGIFDTDVGLCGETTFALFASLLDSALQGLNDHAGMYLNRLGECYYALSRYWSDIQLRVVEDELMRQKVQLLLDEAASWSLLWYLYGKGTEEPPEDHILLPSTSHIEACQFVVNDHTTQLCLRIVQWLEGLPSKALELESKVRGSHVGTYLPNSGIWRHTQRFPKKGASSSNTVHHLDFDAPAREHTHQLPDDKVALTVLGLQKLDESLLEDVWTLLRAGRLEEACDLCRSAGQPWRAVTLCPFGGMDLFPSVEALVKNGKNRTLQAIELESGLWKWASYCTSESACWAMAKSWLDVQVDLELAHSQPGRMEQLKSYGDDIEGNLGQMSSTSQPLVGPESWPLQVLKQQPRDLSSLLQKLHSGEMVHEAVARGCKEQQRQIEMKLMLGNIPHLLELLWSWIAPSEDDHMPSIMIRIFGYNCTDMFL